MNRSSPALCAAALAGLVLARPIGAARALDDSRPLSEYWINSSHNTYLEGNQFTGAAQLCTYRLFYREDQGGCVEIDPVAIKDHDVLVTHYGTLITPIRLSEVLDATLSWVRSQHDPLPVILSIDNKALRKQSDLDAVWEVFRQHLYRRDDGRFCHETGANCGWYLDPELVLTEGHRLDQVPLRELRGKVLIKGDLGRWAHLSKTSFPIDKGYVAGTHGEMKSLDRIRGWEYAPVNFDVVRSTMHNFIRVFPYPPSSIHSQNYPQMRAWLHGAQMAAINIQRQDRNWEINRVMFRDGPYRLKPEWMRAEHTRSYPRLHDLDLQAAEADSRQLQIFPPGDETKKAPAPVADDREKTRTYTFIGVNVTLPILYVAQGDFRGAVEVPWDPHKLSGEVTVTLNRWKRTGLWPNRYLGPGCNYASTATRELRLRYTWRPTGACAVKQEDRCAPTSAPPHYRR